MVLSGLMDNLGKREPSTWSSSSVQPRQCEKGGLTARVVESLTTRVISRSSVFLLCICICVYIYIHVFRLSRRSLQESYRGATLHS